jgi:hypothetical protein
MLRSNALQEWLERNAKEWRKEFKFITSSLPAVSYAKEAFRFRETYQERIVNSIYFDTMNLDFFYESVDGQPFRFKPRVRWYSNASSPSEAFFEFKVRLGSAGGKVRIPLGKVDPVQFKSPEKFRAWAMQKTLAEPIRMLSAACMPTLQTSYRRRYFQGERGLRATLDYELSASRLFGGQKFSVGPRIFSEVSPLLELKCPIDLNINIGSLLASNAFRASKFSKYVGGITYFSEQY